MNLETYLPGKSTADVEVEIRRFATAVAALAAAGRPVAYHGSVFVAEEESSFCQVTSDSVGDVHAVLRIARVL